MNRKTILLKACKDLLEQCKKSHYVLDILSVTVKYDEADCDGYCLLEDIKLELEETEEVSPIQPTTAEAINTVGEKQ